MHEPPSPKDHSLQQYGEPQTQIAENELLQRSMGSGSIAGQMAGTPPPLIRMQASDVLQLQRVHGNQTTLRMLGIKPQRESRSMIQRASPTELAINSVDLSGISGNANKLKEFAAKVAGLATAVREEGTHWYGNDDDLINCAANLSDMAGKLTSAASAMENITRGLDGGVLEAPAEQIEKATKLLKAADLISNLAKTDEKLEAFKNDPENAAKAEAWATSVGSTFDAIGELIPDSIPLLPGFIPQYFKGLMSAPSNYIKVFIALQKDRDLKIDSLTGGSNASQKVVDGDTVVWEGSLTGVFYRAFFVDPPGLQAFMLQNDHTINGVDLWEASYNFGLALIIGRVQSISDDAKREGWLAYLNQF